MERINQKQTNEDGKTGAQSSRRPVFVRLARIFGAMAILVIIVLHFAWQFAFLRSEKTLPVVEEVKVKNAAIIPENEQLKIETGTEREPKKTVIVKTPKVATAPPVSSEPKNTPARTTIKKPEPRESRAERLRRAEKILTGV